MQDEQRGEEEKRQAIKEEKEKKITGSSGSGGGGEVPKAALAVELPNELVVLEVLTRLPVKSLMRFKCVSNLWRSTISQDPSFSKIHRAWHSPSRAGGFSLHIPTPMTPYSLRCFYATTLPSSSCPGGGESVLLPHQFTATASNSCSKYNGATDVVKGLFCLYADESFQEIYPPPKSSGSVYSEDGSLLLQFGGHFALVRGLHSRLVKQELKIWVLELNKYKQGSYEWINRIIEVPWDFPVRGCSFTGNLPLPTGDQIRSY
ncbi:hypothetical protein RHGRI_019532 [Rhododendron griersonianum]|uniref:F-box domain-containing protein n=1 Tax=Rhododendron griersonianum TaxID=479676 RepID=A0AAV6JGD3_9ERIC|nr:hypothetical protein RHGRI_019532 [Rhododendron griersonianum]